MTSSPTSIPTQSAPATRLVASTRKDYNYESELTASPSRQSPLVSNRRRRSRLSPMSSSKSGTSRSDEESTEKSGSSPASSSSQSEREQSSDDGNFRTMLWSADGTSLITSSADNVVQSFILPPTLLQPPTASYQEGHHLKAYTSHVHPSPVYATALSPYYNLSAPETTLILSSPSSLPIRLFSPFAPGILATYPLVNPSTEKWIAPHSLLFSTTAQSTEEGYIPPASLRFLAGSQNQISVFDVNRDGEGPMTTLPTAPGNRKARRGGGLGMVGIVSAVSISVDGILAAGTFSRGVGLYGSQGMGDTVGTWTLDRGEDGCGVTSLHWSRCGRYLVVAEREADGMSVWDIRGTGTKLAWLTGRKANTMQRLGIALGVPWNAADRSEDVFAGGTDGVVRVWESVGSKEGEMESDWSWQAHEDVVSGIGVHACGSVVATCSGSRHDHEEQLDDASDSENETEGNDVQGPIKQARRIDNSIRVWSLEELRQRNHDNIT